MNVNPKVSIITVCYNAETFIEGTIKSIVSQTFTNLEYLIIDGQSTDRTLEIAEKYKDRITSIVFEPDKGVYDAMNKGLARARGQYVLFMNAGDELSKATILEEIFSTAGDEVDLFYGETNILNKDREIIGTRTELTSRKLPRQLTKKDFLNGQVVSHQSFIPKRALAKPYNLKYSCSADIDWMLHIITRSKRVTNVNQPISNYLQGGISDTKLLQCWKERFLILMKYFNPVLVIAAHIRFAFRFLRIGAYKSRS